MEPTKQLILPVIPKDRLEDGAYYFGKCRNPNVSRWNAAKGKFVHWIAEKVAEGDVIFCAIA